MPHIAPDTMSRLKPDLLPVVHRIYSDMCHLQSGERVLILSDARTPWEIIAVFQGMAATMGAEATVIEAGVPYGGPTYQPETQWPDTICKAAMGADLIIDMAVGYADFLSDAMEAGARVLMPGDGIGGPYLDDMLIRTIRDADIHAIRRAADRIADLFTNAATCTLQTGEDSVLEIDISGLEGIAADGFLWDADKGDWKSNYAILPPAQPGVGIPKGRANGTVCVDGTVLWHQVYHEQPRDPLFLTFENSRLTDLAGDRFLVSRLRGWLDHLGDSDAMTGPNHLNIGLNSNALMTQNQEWERMLGSITCGMGDLRVGAKLMGQNGDEWPVSRVHWDWTVLTPTLKLDQTTLVDRGRLMEYGELYVPK